METFAEHYASMRAAVIKHIPNVDINLVNRAVEYATLKHKTQKRKDGSPYIIHPLAVAEIVAEMGLDTDAVLAAVLHDCIEDTNVTHNDIARIFNPTVAELVEGVTKLTKANFSSTEEAQMENLRNSCVDAALSVQIPVADHNRFRRIQTVLFHQV